MPRRSRPLAEVVDDDALVAVGEPRLLELGADSRPSRSGPAACRAALRSTRSGGGRRSSRCRDGEPRAGGVVRRDVAEPRAERSGCRRRTRRSGRRRSRARAPRGRRGRSRCGRCRAGSGRRPASTAPGARSARPTRRAGPQQQEVVARPSPALYFIASSSSRRKAWLTRRCGSSVGDDDADHVRAARDEHARGLVRPVAEVAGDRLDARPRRRVDRADAGQRARHRRDREAADARDVLEGREAGRRAQGPTSCHGAGRPPVARLPPVTERTLVRPNFS